MYSWEEEDKRRQKQQEEEELKREIRLTIIIVVSVILVLIFLFGSFRTVKSGEIGIRVRFGKVVNTKVDDGLNLKLPIVEKIVKMNVKVQKVDVKTESSSKDLQLVNMQLAVNYKVNGNKAVDLYKNVGTKYEEVVLQPAIQESVKAVSSRYTAEELITKRNEVSVECMKELDAKINKYGLTIDNFNITNFNFSAAFNNAIEEKKVAEQKVLTAKQELEKSKVEAERKVVEANAEKQVNELKQQTLTDKIIRDKFIEKWDGKLPTVMGEGSSILDISSLLK